MCQDLFAERSEMREENIQYWLSFCNFVADAYKYIRFRLETRKIYCYLLYDILTELVKPTSLKNFEEVQNLNTLVCEVKRSEFIYLC